MAYAVVMETPAALPSDMWDQTPPVAQAYMRTLEARLAAVESMSQPLPEQHRALQAQLNQTSQHASQPPSSAPPQSLRPRRPRGQRRRGGQRGHPGQTRTLLPLEDVEAVVVLKPAPGRGGHARLSGDDPAPLRHQVIERPPIQPVSTAYQWPQRLCPACGATTRPPWPPGGPSGP